jgi:hypothetical protein
MLLLSFCSVTAPAGTLSVGTPVVRNNQYTFPINLQGEGEGVAALDFRLAYDPAVFAPVTAQTGTSAVTAQKQVSSNVAEPGEFVVVMMGFNQNVVQPGTVVEVVLEKIGEPQSGQSELLIAEPTMATHEGVKIDSSGLARVVKFGKEAEANQEETTPPPTDTTDDGTKTPESPTENPDDMGAKPAGGIRFIVAEQTENKARKTLRAPEPGRVGTGNTPGPATTSQDATGGAPAPELPAGDAALPDTTMSKSPTSATATASATPASVASGGDGTPITDASLASVSPSTQSPTQPAGEPAGNRSILFVTLALVAIVLPITAVLHFKVLR